MVPLLSSKVHAIHAPERVVPSALDSLLNSAKLTSFSSRRTDLYIFLRLTNHQPHASTLPTARLRLRPTQPRLYEFAIKYLDRSSSLGIELAFVWWGPTFVTLCFTALAALARLWTFAACGGKSRGGGGLYPSFSRFVAGFGVAAVLDPYLLFIVDMCASNHNCSARRELISERDSRTGGWIWGRV